MRAGPESFARALDAQVGEGVFTRCHVFNNRPKFSSSFNLTSLLMGLKAALSWKSIILSSSALSKPNRLFRE